MPVIDTLDFHYFRINIAASSSYRIGFLMQTLEPSVGNIASAFSVNIIGTEEVKSSSWILLSYFTTQLKSIHNRHFDVAYYEIIVIWLELFDCSSAFRGSVNSSTSNPFSFRPCFKTDTISDSSSIRRTRKRFALNSHNLV